MAYIDDSDGVKKHAPATERNRTPLLSVLRNELPEWGTVLEIASGSGQHAAFFAENMPQLAWQPSDPDPEALASINAYRADYDGVNLREAMELDASAPRKWGMDQADAVVCINMIHISPWQATQGLFEGAAKVLALSGGPLILYGPMIEPGVETAESNLAFSESLQARNPDWGVRNAEQVVDTAKEHGFEWSARYKMPANNVTYMFRPKG